MKELRKISKEELNEIIKKHELWLNGQEGGERADFSYADFSYANLSYADLRHADLRGVNFSYANLSNVNLSNANLRHANFSYADFSYVNLRHADLSNADLSNADLRGVNFSGSFGLMSSIDFMNYNFEKTNEGYIAYKTFNCFYYANLNWEIEIGSVIEEEVNYSRTDLCGCGINVATLDWIKSYCPNHYPIYKVLIRNEWLMGVCVPYDTDGKIRCAKVEIIGIVEEGHRMDNEGE